MKKLLIVLLVIPGGLLCLGMLGLSFFILAFFPPLVTWVAVGIMVLLGAWFLFGRRDSSNILAGSESSLMGRQKSKEGLL